MTAFSPADVSYSGRTEAAMARAVLQRVQSASVTVSSRPVAKIGRGLVILLGIQREDDERDIERMVDKVAALRIFEDDAGKMNLSTAEAGGEMLVVSQFTLLADVRKGRRPSFIGAASPVKGLKLYKLFVRRLEAHGYAVERGEFGSHMVVSIDNDGPVTIILDSSEL